jgi:hypothetical protein
VRELLAKGMPCRGAETSDVIVISEKSKRIRVLLMAVFAGLRMQYAQGGYHGKRDYNFHSVILYAVCLAALLDLPDV